MKKLYIVANWKANMTEQEAIGWLETYQNITGSLGSGLENKEIIVCPPFTLLSSMKAYISKNAISLQLGGQDVSVYGRGAYTGELPAALLHDYVTYVLVGHSERRVNFQESNDTIATKVSSAVSANLLPILCVEKPDEHISPTAKIVAYEPVSAIGTGRPDTPGDADSVAKAIKEKNKEVMFVLYGGSVTAENIHSFTQKEHIDGVLVGKASLDAHEFSSIVQHA